MSRMWKWRVFTKEGGEVGRVSFKGMCNYIYFSLLLFTLTLKYILSNLFLSPHPLTTTRYIVVIVLKKCGLRV